MAVLAGTACGQSHQLVRAAPLNGESVEASKQDLYLCEEAAVAAPAVDATAQRRWASPERPFGARSLWNSRPVNPRLGDTVLPPTAYLPRVGPGEYSLGVFVAAEGDPPVTIAGTDGSGATLWNADAVAFGEVRLPRWPSDVSPAAGDDGHADVVDPVAGVVHSFWRLRLVGGQWRAAQYAWSPLAGTGWGDPAHYHQGARATGVPSLAGLIRRHEVDDGDCVYRHALAMTLPGTALSATPSYVFPATGGDVDSAALHRGGIAEGSLMMLPPSFDTTAILQPQLRRIARTLQVYGARVVDRNSETRYAIHVENGSSFDLMPAGWSWPTAHELERIADALRPVVGEDGFVDGDGLPFTPDRRLNLMSMRGPWYVEAGVTAGRFDSATQAVDFAAGPKRIKQTRIFPARMSEVSWGALEGGTPYLLSVEASGGATLKLTFRDAQGSRLVETPELADGQSARIVSPAAAGAQPMLELFSGVEGRPSSVRGRLVRTE